MAESIRNRSDTLGRKVDEVKLHVDYQIIEHFSENLYDSPNKAVEELVANGFDAFATEVQVFTPGSYSADRILVWDNGESMDIAGLKNLWLIAKSPKEGDREQERNGRKRKLIGKFGIGKLASYAVGHVISHLCRHGDEFYLVSVDYGDIHGNDDRPPVSHEEPITTPILQLEEGKARALVESLFDEVPSSLDRMLDWRSWTLAVVEELKVDDLPEGRLMWVLGNGMPLRPDFAIKVNGQPVQSKLKKKAEVVWDFGSDEVKKAVEASWRDAVKDDHFKPIKELGGEVGLDPSSPADETPYLKFAHLGKVWGEVKLFEETLLKYRSSDSGRSHGFFLMIRGRLTNPDDPELFLAPPSFQTFYRAQFIIHADDLDDELLADRQRLRRNLATQELELLQKAIYSAARTAVGRLDDERAESQSTRSVLPVGSRTFYRAPLNALLVKTTPAAKVSDFDPVRPKVDRKPLGEDEPIAIISLEEGGFHINTLHPYYAALEKRVGKSKAAREFLRTFDLFAISERLLEGHLYDLDLEDDEVREIISWREGLFRQLARSYDEAPEVINDMVRTSSLGDRPFERALHKVFADMGFGCRHDGAKGKKDILVSATVGPESYSFTIEAKGSKARVGNKDAAVGAAASHRDEVGADHALIIAREFGGFGPNRDRKDAALMEECTSTGCVSFMELNAVEAIHRAIDRFSYPLPLLREIFTTLEPPAEKMRRIESLTTPTAGFDYLELLQEIWKRQGAEAEGDAVPYRSVYQQGRWKDEIAKDDFERRLVALETLAAGRVHVTTNKELVYLRQSPDLILAQIERSLRGEGHDIPEDSRDCH